MRFNPFAPAIAVLAAKIFAGLAALFLVGFVTQTIRIEGAWFIVGFKQQNAILRIDLEKVRVARDTEIAKHQATKKAYADAQAEAERLEAARLARVTAQQEDVTNARLEDYDRRIAAARADADRLRAQAGAARSGAAGAGKGIAVPGVSAAAGGADGAAGGRRLSLDERLVATETAIRLETLQDWVRGQSGVNPN